MGGNGRTGRAGSGQRPVAARPSAAGFPNARNSRRSGRGPLAPRMRDGDAEASGPFGASPDVRYRKFGRSVVVPAFPGWKVSAGSLVLEQGDRNPCVSVRFRHSASQSASRLSSTSHSALAGSGDPGERAAGGPRRCPAHGGDYARSRRATVQPIPKGWIDLSAASISAHALVESQRAGTGAPRRGDLAHRARRERAGQCRRAPGDRTGLYLQSQTCGTIPGEWLR